MKAFLGEFDRVTLGVATGVAGLVTYAGIALVVVVGAWDLWEGLRRERLDREHRKRRGQRIAGP